MRMKRSISGTIREGMGDGGVGLGYLQEESYETI